MTNLRMPRAAGALRSAVAEFCAARFAEIDTIAAATLPHFATDAPVLADLALDAACHDLLTAGGTPLVGAGLVFAPGVLRDQHFCLEWWQVRGGAPERLLADLDPQSVTFRDYTALQWFDVPRSTGRRQITGPYVDYLCTDQLTLTFTAPLLAKPESDEADFVGVAGVDVLVRTLEVHLSRQLSGQIGLAVVNSLGRVVASGDAALLPGDLVAREWDPQSGAAGWRHRSCADLPLSVVWRD